MQAWHEIRLNGLDGSNLLAYLAALGTLRTLALERAGDVRLSWSLHRGSWRPLLHDARLVCREDVVSEIARSSCGGEANPAFTMAQNLNMTAEEFGREAARAAGAARPDLRAWADFLAAFACEACAKDGQIQDTAFRTMSGAGHQHFLEFMATLHSESRADHFDKALFRPWDYSDPKPALRWDPHDYRPHALRANDPSDDPILTMRGANRLAIEALPLFPAVPSGRGLITTGFSGVEITWPIWEAPADLGTVRSLVGLSELQAAGSNRSALSARGVRQVYRSRRFTEGKFRNFSVAVELM